MRSHGRSNKWDQKRTISTFLIDRPAVTLTLECFYPGNQANPPLHLMDSTPILPSEPPSCLWSDESSTDDRVQAFALFLQQVCRLGRWGHLTARSQSQTHRLTLTKANINLPRLFCYRSRWCSANRTHVAAFLQLSIYPSISPSLFCWGCCLSAYMHIPPTCFSLIGNFSQSQ